MVMKRQRACLLKRVKRSDEEDLDHERDVVPQNEILWQNYCDEDAHDRYEPFLMFSNGSVRLKIFAAYASPSKTLLKHKSSMIAKHNARETRHVP